MLKHPEHGAVGLPVLQDGGGDCGLAAHIMCCGTCGRCVERTAHFLLSPCPAAPTTRVARSVFDRLAATPTMHPNAKDKAKLGRPCLVPVWSDERARLVRDAAPRGRIPLPLARDDGDVDPHVLPRHGARKCGGAFAGLSKGFLLGPARGCRPQSAPRRAPTRSRGSTSPSATDQCSAFAPLVRPCHAHRDISTRRKGEES